MTAHHPRPAEAFPAREYVADELAARRWSAAQLATRMDVPAQAVADLLDGRATMTPDLALRLGRAFGTGPELWVNLDAAARRFGAT